jgi:hypothetical protein
MEFLNGLLWGAFSSYVTYYVARSLWVMGFEKSFGKLRDATMRVVNLFFHIVGPAHAASVGRLEFAVAGGICLGAAIVLFGVLPHMRNRK